MGTLFDGLLSYLGLNSNATSTAHSLLQNQQAAGTEPSLGTLLGSAGLGGSGRGRANAEALGQSALQSYQDMSSPQNIVGSLQAAQQIADQQHNQYQPYIHPYIQQLLQGLYNNGGSQ